MDNKNKIEKLILIRAKEILSSPEKWIRGSYAQDKAGEAVNPIDSSAVCFCLSGAIHRAAYDLRSSDGAYSTQAAKHKLRPFVYRRSITHFNDMTARSFDDVIEALDRAIKSE